jgi:hypothetical protein
VAALAYRPLVTDLTLSGGVFVAGMHRSGTSAMAKVVNLLGVPLCVTEDLMLHYGDNPKGHWESRSLTTLNDKLLRALHAAWDCPPPVEEQASARDDRLPPPADARRSFLATHPTAQWAWKDPRLSILLPYWHGSLDGRHLVVLLFRHPVEVADSLRRRDGLAPRHVLAMWERYLRHGLISAADLPTLVVDYAELLSDPGSVALALRSFLRDHGLCANDDTAAAAGFIDAQGRHHERHDPSLRSLSTNQHALWELLRSLSGRHEPLRTIELPAETPELTSILAPRRRYCGWRPTAAEASALDATLGVAPYRWDTAAQR